MDLTRFTADGAAAAALGTNLTAGVRWQSANYARVFQRLGYVGSAAAGDAIVQLFIGDTYLGDFDNTITGLVITDDLAQMKPVNVGIFPFELINIIVSDIGATNATRAHADVIPV